MDKKIPRTLEENAPAILPGLHHLSNELRGTPQDWTRKGASRMTKSPPTDVSWQQKDRLNFQNSQLNNLLPKVILRQILENTTAFSQTPTVTTKSGAILKLFYDPHAGFANKEEGLRQSNGTLGQFASGINNFFTQVDRFCQKAGGDIVSFSMNSIIILWTVREMEDETLTSVTCQAVSCAYEIQHSLADFQLDGSNVSLPFFATVGCGSLCIAHIGGGRLNEPQSIVGRREFVVSGEPFRQLFNPSNLTAKLSHMNDVVVSRQVWTLVKDTFSERKDRKLPNGFMSIGASLDKVRKNRQREEAFPVEWVKPYIPRAAHYILESETLSRKDLISESRQVTILSVNLGIQKSDYSNMSDLRNNGMKRLHELFSQLQKTVSNFEGSVVEFFMDDHQAVVLSAFGLPPFAHENDATRGVFAALIALAKLRQLGCEPSIGIATGIAFCGVVGHRGGRRKYSILGKPIELARELMERAFQNREGALCELQTAQQADSRLSFSFLRNITLNQSTKKVSLFQPSLRESPHSPTKSELSSFLGQENAHVKDQLIRFQGLATVSEVADADLKKLKARISEGVLGEGSVDDDFDDLVVLMSQIYKATTSNEQPKSVLIESSIGMGKSRLLSRLVVLFEDSHQRMILSAQCNPLEMKTDQSSHFKVVKSLFMTAMSQMTTQEKSIDQSVKQQTLSSWLEFSSSSPQLRKLLFLLNSDLETNFLEDSVDEINEKMLQGSNESTAIVNEELKKHLNKKREVETKVELIYALFQGLIRASQQEQIICILDDVLYMSEYEWRVFLRLQEAESGKKFQFVFASRPITDFVEISMTTKECYLNLKTKVASVLTVNIPNLPEPVVHSLATKAMKVDTISSYIAIALEKAQGNPFFVKQLVQSMLATSDVLDLDLKRKVATFGKAAQMKLNNKDDFPMCQGCSKQFARLRDKKHCSVCGWVLCIECCPVNNKRQTVGYSKPVRCCLHCSRDESRARQFTIEAIGTMHLEPPIAIVSVIGAWIDKLSTKQQMILKMASLLRQELRFKKAMVFQAYPLDNATAYFDTEFDALVQRGFIRRDDSQEASTGVGVFISDVDDDVYTFCHNFLPDVLNQRILPPLRDELQNHLQRAGLKREEEDRKDFMDTKRRNLDKLRLKDGKLLVHKNGAAINRKLWKLRWALIVGHRIEFYYDRDQKMCAAACDLRFAKVFNEKTELSGRKRVIKISAPSWQKRGKPVNERRDFFISPELNTDQERDQWIYFLNMAIEASSHFSHGSAGRPAERGTSLTGWFRPKAPGSAEDNFQTNT